MLAAARPHAAALAIVVDDLDSAAIKAADLVWERGVLLKGNGLCHGIAGASTSPHRI